jgi:tetratricopeptide (TPR) repeat protein
MKRAAAVFLAFSALLGLRALPQDEEPQVYVEKVEANVITELDLYIKEKRWRDLFQYYRGRVKVNLKKLVPSPSDNKRLINFSEYLLQRFAGLPEDALDTFRMEFNGPLTVEAETAIREKDLRRLEAAVEFYFFAKGADLYSDRIANQYFEQGLWGNALKHWRRILRFYPNPQVDRPTLAAKMISAAELMQSEPLLKEIKDLVRGLKIDGSVLIADREMKISEWIDAPRSRPAARQGVRYEADPPYFRTRYETLIQDYGIPTTEMKRASFSLGNAQVAGGMRVKFSPSYFAAYTELGSRRFLLMQDGQKIRCADPERASLVDEGAGVYWEDEVKDEGGRRNPPMRDPGYSVRYFGPLIGCVVDGEDVYANMLSRKETGETGPDPMRGQIYRPTLINSIRKYRLVDGNRVAGRLLKTTDEHVFDRSRKLEFVKDRFYFSYPMVISEDRLYVGVVAESQAEQESYVVCLDKETLDVVWYTFICAARTGGNQWWGQGMDYTIYPTTVSLFNGLVYAQTNLGAVAALDPVTGHLVWINTYHRETQPNVRQPMVQRPIERPANVPLGFKSRIYVLPMDAKELMILDSATGTRSQTFDLPSDPGAGTNRFEWSRVHHLIGFTEAIRKKEDVYFAADMVLLSGGQGMVAVDIGDPAYSIKSWWGSGTSEDGQPCLYGRYLYVPVGGGSPGLRIYDLQSFKLVFHRPWPESQIWGNVLVTHDFLFLAGSAGLTGWTNSKYALRNLELKTCQGPADPDLLYKYGLELMRSYEGRNDVQDLRRARDRFSTFIYLAGKDPAFAEPVRDARTRLYTVFSRMGEHALRERKNYAEAIEHYRNAKEFAYSPQTIAETALNLAEANTRAGSPSAAVDEYVDIIRRARDATLKRPDKNTYEPAWRHARSKIDELVQQFGAPVRDHVESIVRKAIKDVGDDVEAALDVIETYPVTQSIREAMSNLGKAVEAVKDPQKRLEILNRIRSNYPDLFKTNFYRPLLKTLEELGDFRRLLEELKKFKSIFGDETFQEGQPPVTVRQYVDGRLKEIEPKLAGRNRRLGDKIEILGRMGAPQVMNTPSTFSTVRLPVRAQGIEPPLFGADLELLSYGSTVELWDLARAKLLWSLSHPGAYLGIVYMPDAGGHLVVSRTLEDSPAADAGVRPQDLILSVDGRPVMAEEFSSVMARYRPGQVVKLGVRRGNGEKLFNVKLASVPPHVRYPVMHAGFTRDYRVVIVWEDMAVCADLQNGQVQWVFSDVRENASLRAGHTLEGRLMLLEAETGRAKHPFRENLQPGASPFCRLISLADSTGEVLSIQVLNNEARGGPVIQARFYSRPFEDEAFLFIRTNTSHLLWVDRNGDAASARLLPVGSLWAECYEPSSGTFYYATMDGSGEKSLRAFQQKEEIWAASLRGLNMMDGIRMDLSASDESVAVTISSQSASQLAVVSPKGQVRDKPLKIPEGLVITSTTVSGGLLFAYGADVGGQRSGNRLAWLVCYSLGGMGDESLWKTRAAYTTPSPGVERSVEIQIEQDSVILLQSNGYSDREKGYGPVVGVHSRRRGGKLMFEMLGWEHLRTNGFSPVAHRGRIYTLERTGNGQVVFLGTRE